MPSNNGGDWIRIAKRMAIYMRDGFDCVWCRLLFPTSELGYKLTLDHIHFEGGNEPHNLVTCCIRCNSSRQRTPLPQWLEKLEVVYGESKENIAHRVLVALSTPINMDEGRRLAKERRPRLKTEPLAAE